jgi:hypothetical protein
MPFINGCQGNTFLLSLIPESHQILREIRVPALRSFLIGKNLGILFFQVANHQFVILVIYHRSSLLA